MTGDRPAIRASDAERERIVKLLREASAEGRLTLEEFAERMASAYEARTHGELEELTRDLPAAGAAVEASRRRLTRFLFSLFGSTEREGRLRVRERVMCLTVFGNIDLDLRQATLEGDVITIVAFGAFAALDVYVPEGVEVDLRGFALFGHARARGNDPPRRPGTPLVRVFAVSLWAGIDIWRVPLTWARRTLSQVIKGIEGAERRELDAGH
jgi:uncharacterized protein DUF1707/cell wall-active antibiotic response 4TMS protein YvqF